MRWHEQLLLELQEAVRAGSKFGLGNKEIREAWGSKCSRICDGTLLLACFEAWPSVIFIHLGMKAASWVRTKCYSVSVFRIDAQSTARATSFQRNLLLLAATMKSTNTVSTPPIFRTESSRWAGNATTGCRHLITPTLSVDVLHEQYCQSVPVSLLTHVCHGMDVPSCELPHDPNTKFLGS